MKKRYLFLFLAALCAAAAAIYLCKDRLKGLPFFNRFLGDSDIEDPEEDILREYEETMAKSSGEEAPANFSAEGFEPGDQTRDKEEKSSKNKIRRGYTEIHFHREEEALADPA